MSTFGNNLNSLTNQNSVPSDLAFLCGTQFPPPVVLLYFVCSLAALKAKRKVRHRKGRLCLKIIQPNADFSVRRS